MTKPAGATEKKFKCKLCDAAYLAPTGLGRHMQTAHGIEGHSKTSLATRKKLETATPAKPIQQNLGGPQNCPECDIVCANKAALANHRRAAHGIKSKAQLARERKLIRSTTELALPEPTTPVEEKRVEKRKPEVETPAGAIEPLIFAIALGEVKERCRRIAEEHDVPSRLFTRQFAELFLREARR